MAGIVWISANAESLLQDKKIYAVNSRDQRIENFVILMKVACATKKFRIGSW